MLETAVGVSQVLLVIVTLVYVFITAIMRKDNQNILRQMKNEQEALFRPYITIAPLVDEQNLFNLVIQNTGKTPAENLKLTIDKDFFRFGDVKKENNLKQLSVFTEPIEMFAPGTQVVLVLAQGFKVFEDKNGDKTPTVFSIHAEYLYSGKTVKEKTTIDLRPFRDGDGPLNLVAENINDSNQILKQNLQTIQRSIKGLSDIIKSGLERATIYDEKKQLVEKTNNGQNHR